MTRRDLGAQFGLLARIMLVSGLAIIGIGAAVWIIQPFGGPLDRMVPALMAVIGAGELLLALAFFRKAARK
jgi:hypothetical protein